MITIAQALALVWALVGASASPGPSAPVELAKLVGSSEAICGMQKRDFLHTTEVRQGNVICLSGPVDEAYFERFTSLQPRPEDVVVVQGAGGLASQAMDVGDRLWSMGNLVVVDDFCGSSCAYFIALGAKRLALTKSGALAFHGGPPSEQKIIDDPKLDETSKAKAISDVRRFVEFFRASNIRVEITNDAPQELRDRGLDWSKSMWFRKGSDLKSYGLESLIYCDSSMC